MSIDNYYISLCKKQITEELNLENDSLVQRDFEYLSKVIFEKSSIDLSTATLRRIWSDEREGVPQAKTLDAMAQVLGFEGWHEFKKANPKNSSAVPRKRPSFNKITILQIVLVTTATVIWIWLSYGRSVEPQVSLSPEKTLHEGVPATIGFNYDIEQMGKTEVKIQLSWNPYEQTLLDPEEHFYTGTYFYPDYHQTKLLAGNNILATSTIHITTQGWHGLVMKSGMDSSPIYIDSMDFMKNDRLAITSDLSEKYSLSDFKELYSTFTFSNTSLNQINGDAFEMKTQFEGLGYTSNRICSQTDIVIKGENESIRIPISSEGCYGITALKCSDVIISGKTNDLSDLSTELLQSLPVSLKVSNNKLSVQIGKNQVFETPYSKSIGRLKVIKFIFTGYAHVTEFEMKNNGLVFKDQGLRPF
ncbi:MAG: hypothetical protein ABJP45_02505 [Cyclobacteriaceae bacterium]